MSLQQHRLDLEIKMAAASARAAATLSKQGLPTPQRPSDEGIPSVSAAGIDLTDLGDQDLMEWFARLTEWGNFLRTQVAAASIDEKAAESVLEAAEATAFLSGWGGKSADRVAASKAIVNADPKVVELREEHAALYAYRKLVEVMADNVDRDTALVSRELTRRTSYTPTSRSNRWSP